MFGIDPIIVNCSYCGQPAGSPCRTKTGNLFRGKEFGYGNNHVARGNSLVRTKKDYDKKERNNLKENKKFPYYSISFDGECVEIWHNSYTYKEISSDLILNIPSDLKERIQERLNITNP